MEEWAPDVVAGAAEGMRRPASLTAALALVLEGAAAAGPVQDAQTAIDHGDFARAVSFLKPLSDAGDPAAQAKLGGLYVLGLGVQADPVEGLLLARRSFAAGSADGAAVMLEICVLHHQGTADDCGKIAEYFLNKAEGGDAMAAMKLSGLFIGGAPGIEKDPAAGLNWLRKAADEGLALAEISLSTQYSLGPLGGLGLPHDPVQARAWLQRAADQGETSAMTSLAMEHQMGLETPKDIPKALALYRKAADAGDLGAVDSLARLYDEGKDVPRDEAQAVQWYMKAAQAGDAEAQAKVGSAFALGKGVQRDAVLAYVWLDVAVTTGKAGGRDNLDDIALARDAAAKHLTAAQKARAKTLIKAQLARQDADP
jgi:TPR repeat protein